MPPRHGVQLFSASDEVIANLLRDQRPVDPALLDQTSATMSYCAGFATIGRAGEPLLPGKHPRRPADAAASDRLLQCCLGPGAARRNRARRAVRFWTLAQRAGG